MTERRGRGRGREETLNGGTDGCDLFQVSSGIDVGRWMRRSKLFVHSDLCR
jgi:hypothetical protein